MKALKVERDSLEKERDDLVTRLWEREKIQEGKKVFSGLKHEHPSNHLPSQDMISAVMCKYNYGPF